MKRVFTLLTSLPTALSVGAMAVLIGAGASLQILADAQQPRPDHNVEVVHVAPEGVAKTRTNITVRFSNDMVSTDSLDLIVRDCPLSFQPPVPGLARWIEPNILRYYPDDELLPATKYRATIQSGGTYINGNRLRAAHKFEFFTPPLTVTTCYSQTEPVPEYPGRVRMLIDLNFNYAVDVDQLRRSLVIRGKTAAAIDKPTFTIQTGQGPSGSPSRQAWRWNQAKAEYASQMTIVLDTLPALTETQEYQMLIKSGLVCRTCEQPLARDFERTFRIEAQRPLTVREMTADTEGKRGVIYIDFDRELAPLDVAKYVTVDPTIDFQAEPLWSRIVLRGDFQSGRTYSVTLTKGIPSRAGIPLEREFSSMVTIPDLNPSVSFVSPGVFLPRSGARLLEIESVNVDSLSLEVEQIFANNLVFALTGGYTATGGYDQSNIAHVGKRFFSKTIPLAGKTNETLTTTADIGAIVGDTARGVFRLGVHQKSQRWRKDRRLVMLTDIGILARVSDDYLMVWTHRLSDVTPIKKARVTLYSENNQVLLEGKTDSRGILTFQDIAATTKGFTPYVIIVETDDDMSYLRFSECLLPTADFDIKGRPRLRSGYEAFVFSDRGVYRPGDTAHIASIVRAAKGVLPPEFPYQISVYNPVGQKTKTLSLSTTEEAFSTEALILPDYARTGKYTLRAHIGDDYQIGSASFQVEDFMPDRIKVEINPADSVYRAGDTMKAEVRSRFLFGPPTAGYLVTGSVTLEDHRISPPGYAGYSFADPDRTFAPVQAPLSEGSLDTDGLLQLRYPIAHKYRPPAALSLLVSAGVSEPGGRMVNAYRRLLVHPYPKYLGIKPVVPTWATPGQPVTVDLTALNTEYRPDIADNVTVRLYRLVYHTMLKKDAAGRYRYVSE
ncbi:MAG: hypothetical protein KKA42_13545, partial [candidate division Zixibacteria bacterium]|nr:hypothetical protein [candidate division Zixibacteria bacterium]